MLKNFVQKLWDTPLWVKLALPFILLGIVVYAFLGNSQPPFSAEMGMSTLIFILCFGLFIYFVYFCIHAQEKLQFFIKIICFTLFSITLSPIFCIRFFSGGLPTGAYLYSSLTLFVILLTLLAVSDAMQTKKLSFLGLIISFILFSSMVDLFLDSTYRDYFGAKHSLEGMVNLSYLDNPSLCGSFTPYQLTPYAAREQNKIIVFCPHKRGSLLNFKYHTAITNRPDSLPSKLNSAH